ncbi:MAG: hypothetical protein IPL75_02630 [Acidobacteria bacterium]|nr:hypothetical protein [Acidobacteriota bacterium]
MAGLRKRFLDGVFRDYGARHLPRVFVETGTFQGDLAFDICDRFARIHTIELSPKWHAHASERLKAYQHITCHLGDSAEVLAELGATLEEPAVFYLDAHFAGGDTAFGSEEVPLMRELSALSTRTWKDIIIIDDLRLIGHKGVSGRPGHPRYPPMEFDWSHLSTATIRQALSGRGRLFWREQDNRIIAFTNLSRLDLIRVRTRTAFFERGAIIRHRSRTALSVVLKHPPTRWVPQFRELWKNRRRRWTR